MDFRPRMIGRQFSGYPNTMPDDHDQLALQFRLPPAPRPRKRARETGRKPAHGNIARLKVTLQHIRPPVWRRLEVPTALSLGALHDILQIAFGWTNSHLHQFHAGAQHFGVIDDESDDEINDENTARLDQILPVYDRLVYGYDFGDDWIHLIAVEKLLERAPGASYPRCIAGRRASPPEDCGGPWGYAEFLRAFRDPDHEEHESMMEWIGGAFDPDAFDPADVNQKLARLAKGKRWGPS